MTIDRTPTDKNNQKSAIRLSQLWRLWSCRTDLFYYGRGYYMADKHSIFLRNTRPPSSFSQISSFLKGDSGQNLSQPQSIEESFWKSHTQNIRYEFTRRWYSICTSRHWKWWFIATSYEHDEYGATTESMELKVKMTEKRKAAREFLWERGNYWFVLTHSEEDDSDFHLPHIPQKHLSKQILNALSLSLVWSHLIFIFEM